MDMSLFAIESTRLVADALHPILCPSPANFLALRNFTFTTESFSLIASHLPSAKQYVIGFYGCRFDMEATAAFIETFRGIPDGDESSTALSVTERNKHTFAHQDSEVYASILNHPQCVSPTILGNGRLGNVRQRLQGYYEKHCLQ